MIPLITPILIYLFTAFTSPLVGLLNSKVRDYYVMLMALACLAIALSFYPQASLGITTYWVGGWAPAETVYGITLALDAFSWLFLLIVALLGFSTAVYSHRYMEKGANLPKYYTLLCLLCAGMSGVVLTGDLFNLFVFTEVTAFSAIGLVAFRGDRNALAAAFNYLVIISLATVLILIAIMLLYGETGTLNMAHVAAKMPWNFTVQVALGLFVAGFAIEAAFFPVYNWLPDAHGGAPSSISAMLSGAIVKMGVYSFLRILFTVYGASGPSGLFLTMGLASMFTGVTLALIQTDFKRLLAYHTVSQMGYIIFGIGIGTYLGIAGGLFHLLNHAIFKGLLFLTAGAVLYRTGTKDLNRLGGLARNMPITAFAFAVGALSISGIPPFNGFASKWILYNASFAYNPLFTVVAVFASALTLASFMKVFHAVFLGNRPKELEGVKEVPVSMAAPMVLLALLCIAIGLFPDVLLDNVIYPAVSALLAQHEYIKAVLFR